MQWTPFRPLPIQSSTYARHVMPIAPLDVAIGGQVPYRALVPIGGDFPCGCGFERCAQNYFEQRFALGSYRIIGFHGGLN